MRDFPAGQSAPTLWSRLFPAYSLASAKWADHSIVTLLAVGAVLRFERIDVTVV
jgi:hypothetical protein